MNYIENAQKKILLQIPDSNITKILKAENGYRIFIREIDVLCGKSGLITKSYEEALFLLFYGRYPTCTDLSLAP
ncbi:MAG: citrate/2-methylcitrate synthase [Holosporaceae bacterium]|jgi:hypothetical protein|nr:citrate/2-methylcitrate synthase [Holosporaceae bacterium]